MAIKLSILKHFASDLSSNFYINNGNYLFLYKQWDGKMAFFVKKYNKKVFDIQKEL
jgi:hypothetical protein